MVAITENPIDLGTVLRDIGNPSTGAVDVFIGIVRGSDGGKQVTRLEYSAYIPMAEDMMRRIEQELRSRWEVQAVILVHRIGTLSVGDVAVVTAVGAAHRDAAFEACRFAIERMKAEVPMWKKEFGPGDNEGRWKEGVQENPPVRGDRSR